jgi:NADPH-dependent ferric siderophore reductase
MPFPLPEQLLHQLVVGDAAAIAAIVDASRTSDDPTILVAAALFAPDGEHLLAQAAGLAATTRDRQLVAIATAHMRGDRDLVDALARDHLVDHPDNVLVAWIAGESHRTDASNDPPTNQELS